MSSTTFTAAVATSRVAAKSVVAKTRLTSIDTLRGFVMVLMSLDHVRDYFSNVHQGLLDPTTTTVGLYITRWITHLCAPTFILLSGVSAYLQTKRSTLPQLSRFLALRGLWLIFLELTVISFAWTYNVRFEHGLYLQVIWAIGVLTAGLTSFYMFRLWFMTFFGELKRDLAFRHGDAGNAAVPIATREQSGESLARANDVSRLVSDDL